MWVCRIIADNGSRDLLGSAYRVLDSLRQFRQIELRKEQALSYAKGHEGRAAFTQMVWELLTENGGRLTTEVYHALLGQAAEFPEQDQDYLYRLFTMLKEKDLIDGPENAH